MDKTLGCDGTEALIESIRRVAAVMRDVGATKVSQGGFSLELGAKPDVADELSFISPERELQMKLQQARQEMEMRYAHSGAHFTDADVEAYAGVNIAG